ncbi:AAA family ATPase [Streptacidiphilus sp. 4-A2]|nr:AAA family ATPase [Streptacidiphilus sp. 4-A2]
MYIAKVEISNILGFSGGRNVELDFTRPNGKYAGWTVLAGRNGSGKTSLLRCLALVSAVLGSLPELRPPISPGSRMPVPTVSSWPISISMRGISRKSIGTPRRPSPGSRCAGPWAACPGWWLRMDHREAARWTVRSRIRCPRPLVRGWLRAFSGGFRRTVSTHFPCVMSGTIRSGCSKGSTGSRPCSTRTPR